MFNSPRPQLWPEQTDKKRPIVREISAIVGLFDNADQRVEQQHAGNSDVLAEAAVRASLVLQDAKLRPGDGAAEDQRVKRVRAIEPQRGEWPLAQDNLAIAQEMEQEVAQSRRRQRRHEQPHPRVLFEVAEVRRIEKKRDQQLFE